MKILTLIATTALAVLVSACGAVDPDEPAADAEAATAELWLTDFGAAKAKAAELQRPILADFTGSDWCGWCIRLDKEVFNTAEFKAYAQANLVLFKADFPRNDQSQSAELKQQNAELARTYEIEGFPTIVLLDAKAQVLGRTGYQPGGAQRYVEHLKTLLSKPTP